MKPIHRLHKNSKSFLLLIVLGLCCLLMSAPVQAADNESTAEIDFSNVDFSDGPTEEVDFSQESWEDDPAEGGETTADLSQMSWEDEPGEETPQAESLSAYQGMSVEEEEALELRERQIHYAGFVLFIGYILGGLLTAYFTRNRKLAVNYPPELLILLHTVWPVEWLFMLFAGKKVR